MTHALLDTFITTVFLTAGLFVGYFGGYKERRNDEKVEKCNAKIEARNDGRSLKY